MHLRRPALVRRDLWGHRPGSCSPGGTERWEPHRSARTLRWPGYPRTQNQFALQGCSLGDEQCQQKQSQLSGAALVDGPHLLQGASLQPQARPPPEGEGEATRSAVQELGRSRRGGHEQKGHLVCSQSCSGLAGRRGLRPPRSAQGTKGRGPCTPARAQRSPVRRARPGVTGHAARGPAPALQPSHGFNPEPPESLQLQRDELAEAQAQLHVARGPRGILAVGAACVGQAAGVAGRELQWGLLQQGLALGGAQEGPPAVPQQRIHKAESVSGLLAHQCRMRRQQQAGLPSSEDQLPHLPLRKLSEPAQGVST